MKFRERSVKLLLIVLKFDRAIELQLIFRILLFSKKGKTSVKNFPPF